MTEANDNPIPRLVVDGLCMADLSRNEIVTDVSFTARAGSVTALIGESGCGKTSVALALLGYARPGMRIVAGAVRIDGHDVLTFDSGDLRRHRGGTVSYVPQSPTSSLSPRQRVGTQVEEVLICQRVERSERRRRVREAFASVALPTDDAFLHRYPFELSGGQLQRVAIAMALATRPKVVVLDEPTTGLDVTTQAKILDLVRDVVRSTNAAFVYVTHDLAVVEKIADRIAVMYAGHTVEIGSREEVFARPAHPYTRMLIRAVPRRLVPKRVVGIPGVAPHPRERPAGCAFAPRCPLKVEACSMEVPELSPFGDAHEVRCLRASELLPRVDTSGGVNGNGVFDNGRPERSALLAVRDLVAQYRGVTVLNGVALQVFSDECVGLVGESGSGKTTLGRCLAGLHPAPEGELLMDGMRLPWPFHSRSRDQLRAIQLVFQNPDRSLNPRETVSKTLMRATRLASEGDQGREPPTVRELLARVRLPSRAAELYPADLSGGERQRVAIARGLATNPRILICDEVTSALDVSIQAAIVDLLDELRRDGVAILFITHNLPLVSAIADRVIVLKGGDVVESGRATDVMTDPRAAYTRDLLEAAPELSGVPVG